MKKGFLGLALALASFHQAKADIVIIYHCGKDTCATIQHTSLLCKDFQFEPVVIKCIDLGGNAKKLDNAVLDHGQLKTEDGLKLGQVKSPQSSTLNEFSRYKITKCEISSDGKITADGILLGKQIK
jgi:hypothetical protein